MNWPINLTLLSFLLLNARNTFCAEQVLTPWESVKMAESFISSFLKAIAKSSAFSSNQLEAMYAIQKTLTEAIGTFNSSNMSSKTKFQALNMVFASAMAEITAVEYGGVSIESKTKDIEYALGLAFQETTGVQNMQFVEDIKNLIFTLANTKATGISTASVVKTGEDKKAFLPQVEPSISTKAMSLSGSIPLRGSGIQPKGSSDIESSMTQNVKEIYGSELPATAISQGQLFQAPTEQFARGLKVPLSMGNPQALTGFPLQRTSQQVPYVQPQPVSGGSGAVAVASSSGTGLVSSVQSPIRSKSNVPHQQSTSVNNQEQELINQGKSVSITQNPSGGATSISYLEGGVRVEQQRQSYVGRKEVGVQEQLTVNQVPLYYDTRAQVSASTAGKQPGSVVDANAEAVVGSEMSTTGPAYSSIGRQGLGDLSQFEAEIRSNTYNSNEFGGSSAAAVATAASDYKPIIGVEPQEVAYNDPASERRPEYSSRRAAVITTPFEEKGPVGPFIAPTRASSLSNTVNSIVSQIGAANPGLSSCNVLIQTMLEIIADLVHLLGYCN